MSAEMDERIPTLVTSTRGGKIALSFLEKHLNETLNIPCWRRIELVRHARNINIDKHRIYIVDLQTLVEQRRCKTKCLPYDSKEDCPDSPIGDIWQDYQFDAPTTTVLRTPELSVCKDLEKTRRREECIHDADDELNQCRLCRGRGSTVAWTQLHVKWSNRSMKLLFPTNIQNVISEEIIFGAVSKIVCLNFDGQWQSTNNTLDHVLDECADLPQELRTEINNRFVAYQRSEKIRRLKCQIERLSFEKITYQMRNHPRKTITMKKKIPFSLYSCR